MVLSHVSSCHDLYDSFYYRLNDEARALIAELGSSYISQIKFRDNWLFVGGKKTINQVSYEEVTPFPKSPISVPKFMQ